jgi:hypothetical protein
MADDLFPEDPKIPSSQDAASNAPPSAGTPPGGPPGSTVQGRGAAFLYVKLLSGGEVIAHTKVFGNLLFVRLAIIVTAHIKSRPDKCLQVYGISIFFALVKIISDGLPCGLRIRFGDDSEDLSRK